MSFDIQRPECIFQLCCLSLGYAGLDMHMTVKSVGSVLSNSYPAQVIATLHEPSMSSHQFVQSLKAWSNLSHRVLCVQALCSL